MSRKGPLFYEIIRLLDNVLVIELLLITVQVRKGFDACIRHTLLNTFEADFDFESDQKESAAKWFTVKLTYSKTARR